MHPLSEFTKELQALELELRLYRERSKSGSKAWAHSLLEECSKDLLASPKALMSAFRRVQADNPDELQAVISVFSEFIRRLAPRVNSAWESENPIQELLNSQTPASKPSEASMTRLSRTSGFRRRGRYAL